MQPAERRANTGCLVSLLVFGIVSSCLCPFAVFAGGLSTALAPDFVARMVSPYLCPPGSVGKIVVLESRNWDDDDMSNAVSYEMQCVAASGEIVRPSSPDFAFTWLGALGAVSLLVSLLLALVLSVPAQAFFKRLRQR